MLKNAGRSEKLKFSSTAQKENFMLQPIHPDFEDYAEKFTTPEPDYLQALYRETNLKTMYPRMLSGHLQGNFLKMISRMIQPQRILEIGTFTGYSAICLAQGLVSGGMLHTIDSNEESVAIGRKYFEKAGLNDRIVTHIGNAAEIIPGIDESFDLVFIDADKENYLNYYHQVFDKVKPGGIILADNAFWDGKVLDKLNADNETNGIIAFNRFVHDDDRVENVLLTIRDGLMVIRKK
jgi:caffeoyl-CoA O-methyltransferase